MTVSSVMAFGASQKESLNSKLRDVSNSDDTIRKFENIPHKYAKNQDGLFSSSKKSSEDSVCCKFGDRNLTDCVSERNADDINQSSDSLSSSASISDSDLTSTDSDDSLAISESESITDVTPLNSPYCDSPLPQGKSITSSSRNIDFDGSSDNCYRPEMNVLMKAVEKLELEAKNNPEFGFRESIMRGRAASLSNEESKRIDQENQRLFKRVIAQQNRMKSMYATSYQPTSKISCKHQESTKHDADIAGAPKKSVGGKLPKQGDKSHTRRRQKCLSHPSSYMYTHNHLADKNLLSDGLPYEDSGKKKYPSAAGTKSSSKEGDKKREKVITGSVEKK